MAGPAGKASLKKREGGGKSNIHSKEGGGGPTMGITVSPTCLWLEKKSYDNPDKKKKTRKKTATMHRGPMEGERGDGLWGERETKKKPH